MDKTIEQKVMEEPDLMAAKMILTDDLQKKIWCKMFHLHYSKNFMIAFLSYRNNVAELEYSELIRKSIYPYIMQ